MEVIIYNIAFKYFSLAVAFFQILINPFWSAFTESFIKNDITWIKSMMKKLIVIWGISCIIITGMVLFSNLAFKIWIGNEINIPISLSAGLAIYMCISNWNSIFVSFNSGVSKIRLQVFLSLIAGIIFIPWAVFLSKRIGLMGIPIAMCLSIIHGSFISPVQYKKLINGKAWGIWNE
ncbi:MAG: hypothetical protein LBE13_15820 [Bacteroidales bacterium]|nr:hypothetical protein [Bacteroidales bacterium]